MTSKKGRLYTIGFNYKCGNCGEKSRHYKNESGMEIWKKLHFKFNHDCKAHNKKYGLGDGFNNSFTDESGKRHFTASARGGIKEEYKLPKSHGHNKKWKKEEAQFHSQQKAYLMKALEDDNYKVQLRKDGLGGLYEDWKNHRPIGDEDDALTHRRLMIMKAKKKREKRQRQKNRKKISKSLTPHHF